MSNGTKVNDMMPDSEKAKIRDTFIELMKEKGFINFKLNPNNILDVDYDISPDQDFVKEICDDLSYGIVKQKSTKRTTKMYQKIKKKANKLEKQMQKKALMTYFTGKNGLKKELEDEEDI